MSKYFEYFFISIRNSFVYKLDFALSIVFEMVYFYIFFALWNEVYTTSGNGSIGSYTLTTMVTYYFATAFMFQVEPSGSIYLGEEIWNGGLTNDLVKPWNAKVVQIIYTLSEILVKIFTYLPFFIFIYITASRYIILPSGINLLLFLITVLLSLVLSISFYLIIHAFTFYYGDQDANIGLVAYIVSFLGGGVFPLALLPNSISQFINLLPFRFLFNEPANIFLGKLSAIEVYTSWFIMIAWILFFYLTFNTIYIYGLKKYTGVGR